MMWPSLTDMNWDCLKRWNMTACRLYMEFCSELTIPYYTSLHRNYKGMDLEFG